MKGTQLTNANNHLQNKDYIIKLAQQTVHHKHCYQLDLFFR